MRAVTGESQYQVRYLSGSHLASPSGSSSSLSLFHSEVKETSLSLEGCPKNEHQTTQYSVKKLFSFMKTNKNKAVTVPADLNFFETSRIPLEREMLDVAPCPLVHLFLPRDQVRLLEENVRNKIPLKLKAPVERNMTNPYSTFQESLIQNHHSVGMNISAQTHDSFPGQNVLRNQSFYQAQSPGQFEQRVHNLDSVNSHQDTETRSFALPQNLMRKPLSSNTQDSFQARAADRSQHLAQDSTQSLESEPHLDEARCPVCFEDSDGKQDSLQEPNTSSKRVNHLVPPLAPNSTPEWMPPLRSMTRKLQERIFSSKVSQHSACILGAVWPERQKSQRPILHHQWKLRAQVPPRKPKQTAPTQARQIVAFRPTDHSKLGCSCNAMKKKDLYPRKEMPGNTWPRLCVLKLVAPSMKKCCRNSLMNVVPDLKVYRSFLPKTGTSLGARKVSSAGSVETRGVACQTEEAEQRHGDQRGLRNISPQRLQCFRARETQRKAPCSSPVEVNQETQELLKDPMILTRGIRVAELIRALKSKETRDQQAPEHQTPLTEAGSEPRQTRASPHPTEANGRVEMQAGLRSTAEPPLPRPDGKEEPTRPPERPGDFPQANPASDTLKIILESPDVNLLISLETKKPGRSERRADGSTHESPRDVVVEKENPFTLAVTEPGGLHRREAPQHTGAGTRGEGVSAPLPRTPHTVTAGQRLNSRPAQARTVHFSPSAGKHEEPPDGKVGSAAKPVDRKRLIGKRRKRNRGEEQQYIQEAALQATEGFGLSLQLKLRSKCVKFEMEPADSGDRRTRGIARAAETHDVSTQTTRSPSPRPTAGLHQAETSKPSPAREAAESEHPLTKPETLPAGEHPGGTAGSCVLSPGDPGMTPDHGVGEEPGWKDILPAVDPGCFISHMLRVSDSKRQKIRRLLPSTQSVLSLQGMVIKAQKLAILQTVLSCRHGRSSPRKVPRGHVKATNAKQRPPDGTLVEVLPEARGPPRPPSPGGGMQSRLSAVSHSLAALTQERPQVDQEDDRPGVVVKGGDAWRQAEAQRQDGVRGKESAPPEAALPEPRRPGLPVHPQRAPRTEMQPQPTAPPAGAAVEPVSSLLVEHCHHGRGSLTRQLDQPRPTAAAMPSASGTSLADLGPADTPGPSCRTPADTLQVARSQHHLFKSRDALTAQVLVTAVKDSLLRYGSQVWGPHRSRAEDKAEAEEDLEAAVREPPDGPTPNLREPERQRKMFPRGASKGTRSLRRVAMKVRRPPVSQTLHVLGHACPKGWPPKFLRPDMTVFSVNRKCYRAQDDFPVRDAAGPAQELPAPILESLDRSTLTLPASKRKRDAVAFRVKRRKRSRPRWATLQGKTCLAWKVPSRGASYRRRRCERSLKIMRRHGTAVANRILIAVCSSIPDAPYVWVQPDQLRNLEFCQELHLRTQRPCGGRAEPVSGPWGTKAAEAQDREAPWEGSQHVPADASPADASPKGAASPPQETHSTGSPASSEAPAPPEEPGARPREAPGSPDAGSGREMAKEEGLSTDHLGPAASARRPAPWKQGPSVAAEAVEPCESRAPRRVDAGCPLGRAFQDRAQATPWGPGPPGLPLLCGLRRGPLPASFLPPPSAQPWGGHGPGAASSADLRGKRPGSEKWPVEPAVTASATMCLPGRRAAQARVEEARPKAGGSSALRQKAPALAAGRSPAWAPAPPGKSRAARQVRGPEPGGTRARHDARPWTPPPKQVLGRLHVSIPLPPSFEGWKGRVTTADLRRELRRPQAARNSPWHPVSDILHRLGGGAPSNRVRLQDDLTAAQEAAEGCQAAVGVRVRRLSVSGADFEMEPADWGDRRTRGIACAAETHGVSTQTTSGPSPHPTAGLHQAETSKPSPGRVAAESEHPLTKPETLPAGERPGGTAGSCVLPPGDPGQTPDCGVGAEPGGKSIFPAVAPGSFIGNRLRVSESKRQKLRRLLPSAQSVLSLQGMVMKAKKLTVLQTVLSRRRGCPSRRKVPRGHVKGTSERQRPPGGTVAEVLPEARGPARPLSPGGGMQSRLSAVSHSLTALRQERPQVDQEDDHPRIVAKGGDAWRQPEAQLEARVRVKKTAPPEAALPEPRRPRLPVYPERAPRTEMQVQPTAPPAGAAVEPVRSLLVHHCHRGRGSLTRQPDQQRPTAAAMPSASATSLADLGPADAPGPSCRTPADMLRVTRSQHHLFKSRDALAAQVLVTAVKDGLLRYESQVWGPHGSRVEDKAEAEEDLEAAIQEPSDSPNPNLREPERQRKMFPRGASKGTRSLRRVTMKVRRPPVSQMRHVLGHACPKGRPPKFLRPDMTVFSVNRKCYRAQDDLPVRDAAGPAQELPAPILESLDHSMLTLPASKRKRDAVAFRVKGRKRSRPRRAALQGKTCLAWKVPSRGPSRRRRRCERSLKIMRRQGPVVADRLLSAVSSSIPVAPEVRGRQSFQAQPDRLRSAEFSQDLHLRTQRPGGGRAEPDSGPRGTRPAEAQDREAPWEGPQHVPSDAHNAAAPTLVTWDPAWGCSLGAESCASEASEVRGPSGRQPDMDTRSRARTGQPAGTGLPPEGLVLLGFLSAPGHAAAITPGKQEREPDAGQKGPALRADTMRPQPGVVPDADPKIMGRSGVLPAQGGAAPRPWTAGIRVCLQARKEPPRAHTAGGACQLVLSSQSQDANITGVGTLSSWRRPERLFLEQETQLQRRQTPTLAPVLSRPTPGPMRGQPPEDEGEAEGSCDVKASPKGSSPKGASPADAEPSGPVPPPPQVLDSLSLEQRDRLLLHLSLRAQNIRTNSFPLAVRASHAVAGTPAPPRSPCTGPCTPRLARGPPPVTLLLGESALRQIDLDLQRKYRRLVQGLPAAGIVLPPRSPCTGPCTPRPARGPPPVTLLLGESALGQIDLDLQRKYHRLVQGLPAARIVPAPRAAPVRGPQSSLTAPRDSRERQPQGGSPWRAPPAPREPAFLAPKGPPRSGPPQKRLQGTPGKDRRCRVGFQEPGPCPCACPAPDSTAPHVLTCARWTSGEDQRRVAQDGPGPDGGRPPRLRQMKAMLHQDPCGSRKGAGSLLDRPCSGHETPVETASLGPSPVPLTETHVRQLLSGGRGRRRRQAKGGEDAGAVSQGRSAGHRAAGASDPLSAEPEPRPQGHHRTRVPELQPRTEARPQPCAPKAAESPRPRPFFYACMPADCPGVTPRTVRWDIPPQMLRRHFPVPLVAKISSSHSFLGTTRKLLEALLGTFRFDHLR